MADPLVSERSMAFGEGPVYSSRDFITVHQSERPSIPGQWYPAGSTFAIALRNIAQNEFLDINQMKVQFSVACLVGLPTATAPALGVNALQMSSARSSGAIMPGVPAFGCPFFSSVAMTIPGLGLESFLRTDKESQEIVASRLLCSSGSGSYDENTGRVGGFKISGKPYDAGCRDVSARSECVWAAGARTGRGGGGAVPEVLQTSGVVTHYSVPMSLFTHLGNGLSSLLPLAYFASGGDLLNMTFRLAPAATALCDIGQDRPDLAGPATYYIIDPCVSFTKTQINNASLLAGIESLYRGVASIPVSPSFSAPMVMTLKDTDYTSAFTTISGASGAFQITIPANEPSVRGVLLKFVNTDVVNGGLTTTLDQPPSQVGAVGIQWAGKHAFSLVPRLTNLQIRIGSYRVPLDPISDLRFDPTAIPGLSGNPFAGFAAPTTPLDCLSTQREAQRLYCAGKHLFSPFMVDEDFDTDALATFWSHPVSRSGTAASELFGPPQAVVSGNAQSGSKCQYGVGDRSGTGLFVIPFESFATVLNQRQDAYALRGLDLRNISSITISGFVSGVSGGYGPGEPDTNAISTSSWTVRSLMAYDRLITILPGRTDISSQFSLLPTGATAVPTGSGM